VTDVEVRLALYREFVVSGRAPAAARLAVLLGEPLEAVREALARLAAGRAIVLQPESREVLYAPPLSGVPTPFVVHSAGRSYFAPCAWDALGAAAMLGGDAEVETSCGCCGEAMGIVVRGGQLIDAQGVIHFAVPARQWWSDLVYT
jgi:Alkylmercury lyase